MTPEFAVFAASAPAVLVSWRASARTRCHRPEGAAAMAFLLGLMCAFAAAIFSRLVQGALGGNVFGLPEALHTALVTAAIPEEATKLALLLAACRLGLLRIRGPEEGVLCGIVLAMGFATAENAFFAVRDGPAMLAMRSVTSLPLHGMAGVLLGHQVGRALMPGARRRMCLAIGFLMTVALHALYNAPLLALAGIGTPEATPTAAGICIAGVLAVGGCASLHVLRTVREEPDPAAHAS